MSTLYNAKTREDVIILLENGANIDENDLVRSTPVNYHASKGNNEVVIALIEYDCNVNIMTRFRDNVLTSSCKTLNTQLVEAILKYENVRELINKLDTSSQPLCIACMKGAVDIFDILIKYGANPNITNSLNNKTPLSLACILNNITLVDKLVNLNIYVNPDIPDNDGNTAIFYCRNVNLLHRLFLLGPSVNIINRYGDTPLHKILDDIKHTQNRDLINNYVEVSISLIDYGADLNIRNKDGETAIQVLMKVNEPFRNEILSTINPIYL